MKSPPKPFIGGEALILPKNGFLDEVVYDNFKIPFSLQHNGKF